MLSLWNLHGKHPCENKAVLCSHLVLSLTTPWKKMRGYTMCKPIFCFTWPDSNGMRVCGVHKSCKQVQIPLRTKPNLTITITGSTVVAHCSYDQAQVHVPALPHLLLCSSGCNLLLYSGAESQSSRQAWRNKQAMQTA